MAYISKIRFWLFVALIVLAPLSKYPSIANPTYNFSSFRFGLYPLLAFVFVLVCAIPTIKNLKKLYLQNRIAFISSLVLLATVILGMTLALDKNRSLLMGLSFIFLLCLVACGWWYASCELLKNNLLKFVRIFFYTSILFGCLSIIEFFVLTLTSFKSVIICSGCSSNIFGFPRINLFAAEPQFLANAMIPFFFVSFAWYFKNKSRLALFSLISSAITICLTFSRGAYFAVFVGIIFYLFLVLRNKRNFFKRVGLVMAVVVATFLVGMLMLVWSAAYRYNSTPNIVYNTADTILDHMTLGIINLPNKNVAVLSSAPTPVVNNTSNFTSPGLIKSSTSDRVGAADLAIDSWNTNAKTILIGVGSGNLGPFTVKNVYPGAPNNLTVYIYYVLLLAEVGLIGLTALMFIYLSGLWRYTKALFKDKNWLVLASLPALIIAFLAQYIFFGTFINSVYIWLWTGILLGLPSAVIAKKRYNQTRPLTE